MSRVTAEYLRFAIMNNLIYKAITQVFIFEYNIVNQQLDRVRPPDVMRTHPPHLASHIQLGALDLCQTTF